MNETEIQDREKIIKFIKKHYWVIFLIIPIILSTSVRLTPHYLPITDEWAKNTVEASIKSTLEAKISEQFPAMNKAYKDQLIQQELEDIKSNQPEVYTEQIKQLSYLYKQHFKSDDGTTYLSELDPYFWYAFTRNILDHGYPADEIKTKVEKEFPVEGYWYNVPYTTSQLAPIGKLTSSDVFNSYFWAYSYKIIHLFSPKMSLMRVGFFIPLFFMGLSIIFIYLITDKIAGKIAGFFAAMILAIHPLCINRIIGGWVDTDVYTLFFPLFISYFFLESFKRPNLKQKLIFISIAGTGMGLFAFAWIGWYFFGDIILLVLFLYALYSLISKRLDKEGLLILLVYLLSSFFVAIYFRGIPLIVNLVKTPISFILLKNIKTETIWPNVMLTVAEQHNIGVISSFKYLGGAALFVFLLFGIFYLIYKKRYKELILFGIYLLITIVAGTRGFRYTQLAIPPFTIIIGVGISWLCILLADKLSKLFKIKLVYLLLIICILPGYILLPMWVEVNYSAKNQFPMMDDVWYNMLQKIDREVSPNTIITSWWDFGHWFRAIGNRPVTFDGTTQNSPFIHWVGKILSTSNEKESINILRMIDCGGNKAYETLTRSIKDELKSKLILDHILLEGETDNSKQILKMYGVNQSLIFCDPPDSYFITSNDMVGKAGVWSHFGFWDFKKAKFFQDGKFNKTKNFVEYNITKEQFNQWVVETKNIKDNQQLNDWVSPWLGYFPTKGVCKNINNTLFCQNEMNGRSIEFTFDLDNEVFNWVNLESTYPDKFIFIKDNAFFVKRYLNSSLGLSICILPEGNNLLVASDLAESMFTRLYFFKGIGLERYTLFDNQKDPFSGEISVWKVDLDV